MNTSLPCGSARSFLGTSHNSSCFHLVVKAGLACGALFLINPAMAADGRGINGESGHEYTISANRLKTPIVRQGNSVTIITEEQIESSKQTQLIEVLKTVPGLDIVQSGGLGGNAAVFLRGANSEHTLVLVDGIEINNPISNSRSFNFSDISLDNVERIEVIRGPQSTVYGSDALGGVINIITKRGGGDFAGSVEAQAGSYSTIIEKASASGGLEGLRYSIGASREDSDSISSAGDQYGNTEDDSYQNTSIASRIGFDPLDQFSGDLILRYNSSRTDLDNSGGFGGDDPNRLLENQQLLTRAEARSSFLEGRFNQRAGISYTSHDLEDSNDPDAAHPLDRLRSNFTGEMIKFDIQSDLKAGEYNTLIFGFETEHEQGSSYLSSESAFGPFNSSFGERSQHTNAGYLEDQLIYGERAGATFGVRIDDNSKSGSEVTWKAAPSYLIIESHTRLKGSVGTGFKSPSLFQLYSEFGRQDLQPEESLGWDVGFEQRLPGDVTLDVTYFRNDFDNLINFDPGTFVFENIAKAETSGIEAVIGYEFMENGVLRAIYTYTDSEDEITGMALLRRPKNKYAVSLRISPAERWHVDLSCAYYGARFDNDFSTFPAQRVKLGGYTIYNVAASYDISDSLELFVRGENLSDKEYEEVFGFGEPGLAVYGGVRLHT